LGADRIAAQPEAVAAIVAICAGLPLALAIVAARAEIDASLTTVAEELNDQRRRLDALAVDDDPHSDLRAVFSWSYRSLSPFAARMFRLLGTHPGPEVSMLAAASLAGLPPEQATAALAELIRTHLLSEPADGRYVLHDLLRAFAAERARSECPDSELTAAATRMIDHYAYAAHAGTRLLDPSREPVITQPPPAGVQLPSLSTPERASRWFTTEHPVLPRIVGDAYDRGLYERAWQLAWAMLTFLDRRGYWDEFIAVQRIAVEASQRAGDPLPQARAHRLLAVGYGRLGQFATERAHLRIADDIYRQIDDKTGQAHVQQQLSVLADRDEDHAASVAHAREALQMYEAIGDELGQALALNLVGWGLAHLGEHEEAIASCRRALLLHEAGDSRDGLADVWDTLGFVHHRQGDYAAAIDAYERALLLFDDVDDRFLKATTLVRLGDVQRDAAPTARAAALVAGATWRKALEILDELHSPAADELQAKIAALDAAAGTGTAEIRAPPDAGTGASGSERA
jgi:tetratricopeptide (TPR) repeat protein